MGRYLIQRMLLMLPTLFLISVVTFVIIQLPPGDFLTTLISDLEASGERADLQKVEFLRQQFGLDQPLWKQYWLWVSGLVQGDMGYSFEYDRPVADIIGERLLLTFVVSLGSILFTWLMAFPIGVYSATHQYSWGDHGLTLVGFLGLATPNFLLALILMFISFTYFGTSVGGLFSPDMQDAPWSWARLWDLLQHLWIPVIVIGTSGTAAMIRRLRANLLDELRRPYVVTARAKGLTPRRILLKYPLRIALNPFIGDIGNLLPQVISGAIIVSIVLSLPTTGPILLRALRAQDMYLAGSFLMLLATLTVIGVFLSDLALAALDPRIRQGKRAIQVSAIPAAETLPVAAERPQVSEQERYYFASQWQLIWWRLRRHRFAMLSLWFLVALYAMIPFVEFLAPYELRSRHPGHVFFPPQRVHLYHEGRLVGPFVYGQLLTVNMANLKREYREDRSRLYRLQFFAPGEPYRMWGLWRADRHLFGVEEGGTVFLLGTDRLGRDMLSRIIHGARISLTVGLLGISVSFVLALVFGGLSGYYGGTVDIVIQRLIEVIRAFPELPLWMALSAALPPRWDPILVYVGITVILGILEWTGLARSVRGKLLAVREEDFATAAVLMGGSPPYIIRRHLLPAFTSHLIVSATLSIPNMILGETALSFLGLGLRPPITSWGVLLSEAQNMNAVALYPWLLTPVVMVVLTVLAFNFLGDGLRDAADPYA